MSRYGDTNTKLITILPENHTLWRCTDQFGREISYIEDDERTEIFHTATQDEAEMMKAFFLYEMGGDTNHGLHQEDLRI